MKKSYLIIAGLFLSLIIFTSCERTPSKYDDLAKCLNKNGLTMYGTEWCPHCKDQKVLLGLAFDFINYVDCDLYPKKCQDAGVKGYPTWLTAEGTQLVGAQSLKNLAEQTNCELPK